MTRNALPTAANIAQGYKALTLYECRRTKPKPSEIEGWKNRIAALSMIRNPCVRDEMLLSRYRQALTEVEGHKEEG